MKIYEAYSRELEKLTLELSGRPSGELDRESLRDILDGQPSRILRELVSVSELRRSGVFFTRRQLAQRLITSLVIDIERGAAVDDPACGVGDLLLACACHLPLLGDLQTTLQEWGRRLNGSDLHPQFVRTTKARLALLALTRGAKVPSRLSALDDLFPKIQVGDTLSAPDEPLSVDCIVLNPPYSKVLAPSNCRWAQGSVSQAALFMDKYVRNASTGTRIVAILPDVLRTGSRYLKWRRHIERAASVESIELVGRFDSQTDVDVFILRLIVTHQTYAKEREWWSSDSDATVSSETVGDYFEVRVGPVVPHRDPMEGPSHPYIHAQQLPPWENVRSDFGYRRYSGTVFQPPFVVVRRTSNPRDKHRAVATIISGEKPVAVENHLLVLTPKSGLLKDCVKLVESIRSPRTNTWLNERIRCRHLTVSALRALPWWIEE